MDHLESLEIVLEGVPDENVSGSNHSQQCRLDLMQPCVYVLQHLRSDAAVSGGLAASIARRGNARFMCVMTREQELVKNLLRLCRNKLAKCVGGPVQEHLSARINTFRVVIPPHTCVRKTTYRQTEHQCVEVVHALQYSYLVT